MVIEIEIRRKNVFCKYIYKERERERENKIRKTKYKGNETPSVRRERRYVMPATRRREARRKESEGWAWARLVAIARKPRGKVTGSVIRWSF